MELVVVKLFNISMTSASCSSVNVPLGAEAMKTW